jgi:hypothetical protein
MMAITLKTKARIPAPPPLLTPAVVRRMAGWSQVRVAAAANTSVASVRVFELDPDAIADATKRGSLAAVYAQLRDLLLRPRR